MSDSATAMEASARSSSALRAWASETPPLPKTRSPKRCRMVSASRRTSSSASSAVAPQARELMVMTPSLTVMPT